MIDGRKNNRPPRNPPALDSETVTAIDEVISKGMKQSWIARQLGVHERTVMAAVNRTGAYSSYPPPEKPYVRTKNNIR